jgi:lysophospholipase L1-like esterase
MTSGDVSTPTVSRKTVIVAGIILVILVASMLEFGTRLFLREYRGYDGKHLYQFDFDPYKNILPTPNYVDTRGIKHNSVGFRRSTEVSVTKPAGTYRIFLMGASTAYGLGGLWPQIDDKYPVLKNTETIDAFLERQLAESLPGLRIEVINAAITSTWTHHNLIYLNQTILKYRPDMVLFLDGFNDYYFYDEGHDQFKDYTYNLPSQAVLGEPTVSSLAYANGWWLFRKSALVHQLAAGAKNLHLLLAQHGPRTPIDVGKAVASHAQVFGENAFKMELRSGLILQSEGIIPVFVLQPMLILERNRVGLTGVERKLFDFNVSSYLPNYEQFITRAVETVRDRENLMAAQVGGLFIDLTPIFKESQGQIFTDYAHLTPLGNQIVAKHITEQILPLIRMDSSSASIGH